MGRFGFDEGQLLFLFFVQHLHYEAFAETFGETDLEDHVVLRLLDGAVGCKEEDVLTEKLFLKCEGLKK